MKTIVSLLACSLAITGFSACAHDKGASAVPSASHAPAVPQASAVNSSAQAAKSSTLGQDPSKHPYASYAKLAQLVSGSDPTPFILLDVRTAEEYASGRIPGAILLPYDSIGPSTAPPAPSDGLIVVYCRSGRRSAIAAEALKRLGFTNIADFGGIGNWKGELER